MSEVKHLGNVLQCDNKMTIDLAQKRKIDWQAQFSESRVSYVEPSVSVKILNIYASSFYGSCLKIYSLKIVRGFIPHGM